MRFAPRLDTVFVLATYLLLSAISFTPVLFGRSVDHPLRIIVTECLLWALAWGICKRPARFHWLLLPAFLALPMEIYLYAYYGQGISANHLGIIAETSPKEAAEFLGSKIWLLSITIVATVIWWALSWIAACRTRELDWNGKSRRIFCVFLIAIIGTWSYGRQFGVQRVASASASRSMTNSGKVMTVAFGSAAQHGADEEDDDETPDIPPVAASKNASWLPPVLPNWAEIPFGPDDLGRAWPFGLAVHVYDFWKEREYLSDLANKSRMFKFGAHQPVSDRADRQLVVMVIGESSRYDRWSLNGYQRETNPLLKLEKNLVSLPDVITAVSATRLSVPILVSRKPAMQSLKAGFTEKSFLSAFKEAGFKTYWLSNQMSFGEFDTPISVFAEEADVTQFMNLGGYTNESSYDQILLAPLKNAIADPAPKKLIVLHTLGSHWNYSHRYPKEFDKWKPSLFGVDDPDFTDLDIKPELNNSYDNSILYTDWFLSKVIGTLKTSDEISSMIYISDHGQTLYDGSCNLAFHGHNTQFEFHVPALVWYSDSYRQTFPDKIAQLLRNRRAKLATENIFHTLVDMADISYGSEKLEWSFLNPKFKRHKRYVDSYGWSDYDNAVFKGDCREVIDKGTPLAQEK